MTTTIDGRKTKRIDMHALLHTARQLAEYAREHWKHLEDVRAVRATIGNTAYAGIRYIDRHTYTGSNHTASFGPVAAGDYTREESFYLLGQVPPMMTRRPTPLLVGLGARCTELHRAGLPQSNHGTGEWYIASYAITGPGDSGAFFILSEWIGPEAIDENDYRGRKRIVRPRKPAWVDYVTEQV